MGETVLRSLGLWRVSEKLRSAMLALLVRSTMEDPDSGKSLSDWLSLDGLRFPKPSDEEVYDEEHECNCRERTHEPVVGGEDIQANWNDCQRDEADCSKPMQNMGPELCHDIGSSAN